MALKNQVECSLHTRAPVRVEVVWCGVEVVWCGSGVVEVVCCRSGLVEVVWCGSGVAEVVGVNDSHFRRILITRMMIITKNDN